MERTFGFIGGDRRQVYAAKYLKQKGFETLNFLMNECEEGVGEIEISENLCGLDRCTDVILPLPVCVKDGILNTPFCCECITLDECVSKINPKARVYAGKLSKENKICLEKAGLKAYDYLNREDFKILNSIPTAEGAIAIAIEETPETLYHSNCLVTGYGRVGKAVCSLLKGFGANVTAVARKSSSIAEAEAQGINASDFSDLKGLVKDKDIIFNTVPKTIFDDSVLENISKDTLIIDLASKPGGVDIKQAAERGIKVIWALSLPGKVSPVTAGEIIAEMVLNIIKESGEDNE